MIPSATWIDAEPEPFFPYSVYIAPPYYPLKENRVPHPDGESGYNFTQVLQWARPFLKTVGQSRPSSYLDIVTTDTIKLR